MSNLQPLDPSVKLPAAIRAAAARAEAQHQAAYGAEPAQEPVKEPQGKEPLAQEPQAQQPAQEPQQEPQVQQEPQAQQEPQPQQGDGKPRDWENMYHSMKGRYDRTSETVRDLTSRLSTAEARIRELSAAPPAPVAAPKGEKLITDEDRQNYGEDFIDVAARAARETMFPELQELRKQVEQLSTNVGGVARSVQTTTRQSMFGSLDANLPNWREVNRSQDFFNWLALPDPYSGAIRQNMLKEAYDANDAARVLNFFKGFLTDEAATDPAGRRAEPTPAQAGKLPLSTLAAPGRAKAPAATPAPGEKETISRAQIANFYRLLGSGHYKGNPEEGKRLEAMIYEAQRDGRIID